MSTTQEHANGGDSQTIPNPTPSGDYYRIIQGSGGGFLCPPGHPAHRYEVRGARRGQIMRNPHTIMSIESAASAESVTYLPSEIVRQARRMLADAQLVCSEAWQRYVYGYFRNSYSPDGADRNAANAVRTGPVEHHLAFLLIKQYFPEHQPRLDLIADASEGYGSKPCAKCGATLQYEAKVDAFAEPITARTTCPEGGEHSTELEGMEA